MTREQAREFLKTLGIEEVSDEQVTNYLNSVNKETQKEKDKAEKYKTDAEKVAELQKQLDAINDANLSEIEKANKAKDEALNQIAKLQADMAHMQLKNELANIGIVGESADKLFVDGKLDTAVLGEILNTKITTAKAEAIKEIADGADGNISGNNGANGSDEGEQSADIINAMKISFGTPADTQARDAYVLH